MLHTSTAGAQSISTHGQTAKRQPRYPSRFFDATHLCKPRENDDRSCNALFFVPEDIGCCGQLRFGQRVIHPSTESDRFLRSRIAHPSTVVWGIRPPHDGEEERPRRREHVIDEKEVCEIERLLCIFLFVFGGSRKAKEEWNLNHANEDRVGEEWGWD